MKQRCTRIVRVGPLRIGGGAPVSVQSMCATKSRDVDATVAQCEQLRESGADVVRIAVDNDKEVEALREIRRQTKATLAVDLQENFRLAGKVGPHVDKIRYNPGHLHHVEKTRSVDDKVSWLIGVARDADCAVRVGVNCGSVAPDFADRYRSDRIEALVQSALYHCDLIDALGFDRYLVSLKDSDPARVVEANTRFAAARPDVPLHLGVTEAGLPPGGITKTRLAFEKLLPRGIGDTIRVSLTLPNARKAEEISAGRQILRDCEAGRFLAAGDFGSGLNIISCPSCSRVENERFIELAEEVRELTGYARRHRITIAVMGCRVNGPGETDDADLGLWCGPSAVVLKRRDVKIGSFGYAEVLGRLKSELDCIIGERSE